MMTTDRDIYEQEGGQLLRFATVLVGPDDASDVVSNVITRVLARRPLADLVDPHQYLMSAVANEAKNVKRSRARASDAVQRLAGPDISPDIAEGRYPDVTEAVLELPAQQRAALYLVYWVGMTAADAARILHCRPSTVRRYLVLARDKLKEYFDE